MIDDKMMSVLYTKATDVGQKLLGVVIVFGVTLSTMLTLFVVPTFYDLLARYTKSPHATANELEAYEAEKDALQTPAE